MTQRIGTLKAQLNATTRLSPHSSQREPALRVLALACPEKGDADSDALFVVVNGRAAVVGRDPCPAGGGERVIAVLGRGDVVGELSVLDGSPRSTTVRPEGGPVQVLRLPGASVRGTLLQRPRAAESLLRILAGRLRRMAAPGEAPR